MIQSEKRNVQALRKSFFLVLLTLSALTTFSFGVRWVGDFFVPLTKNLPIAEGTKQGINALLGGLFTVALLEGSFILWGHTARKASESHEQIQIADIGEGIAFVTSLLFSAIELTTVLAGGVNGDLEFWLLWIAKTVLTGVLIVMVILVKFWRDYEPEKRNQAHQKKNSAMLISEQFAFQQSVTRQAVIEAVTSAQEQAPAIAAQLSAQWLSQLTSFAQIDQPHPVENERAQSPQQIGFSAGEKPIKYCKNCNTYLGRVERETCSPKCRVAYSRKMKVEEAETDTASATPVSAE